MAGKKGFTENLKKINPNTVLAGNYKEPDSSKNDNHEATETKPVPSKIQQNKNKNKKGQKYLRLDLTDYQDYVSLMSDYLTNTSGKYVSMTQYILRLIEADKQHNIELYKKLEQIENMKRELI